MQQNPSYHNIPQTNNQQMNINPTQATQYLQQQQQFILQQYQMQQQQHLQAMQNGMSPLIRPTGSQTAPLADVKLQAGARTPNVISQTMNPQQVQALLGKYRSIEDALAKPDIDAATKRTLVSTKNSITALLTQTGANVNNNFPDMNNPSIRAQAQQTARKGILINSASVQTPTLLQDSTSKALGEPAPSPATSTRVFSSEPFHGLVDPGSSATSTYIAPKMERQKVWNISNLVDDQRKQSKRKIDAMWLEANVHEKPDEAVNEVLGAQLVFITSC